MNMLSRYSALSAQSNKDSCFHSLVYSLLITYVILPYGSCNGIHDISLNSIVAMSLPRREVLHNIVR